MKKKSTAPASDREKLLIQKIKNYVHENINKDYNLSDLLADLAKYYDIKEYFLTDTFPQICKQSVIDYRRKQRLLNAVKKIATGTTAKQAAKEAFYNTTGDFYRAFKQTYKQTPKEYITKHIEKN